MITDMNTKKISNSENLKLTEDFNLKVLSDILQKMRINFNRILSISKNITEIKSKAILWETSVLKFKGDFSQNSEEVSFVLIDVLT